MNADVPSLTHSLTLPPSLPRRYDTIKGADWLGDQDAIQYMCREAGAYTRPLFCST